jgi:hypothetical protein
VNAMEAWLERHGRRDLRPKPRPVDAPQAPLIDVEAGVLTQGARRDQLVAEMPAEWRERQRALEISRRKRSARR